MAWTAPMTATAGSVFTAADFNTYIRDNLNETAVAKATTAGRIFVATGENSLAERAIGNDTAGGDTYESTSSQSFADLNTVGPSVELTTGGSALVFWGAQMQFSAAGHVAYMGIDISGATTLAAADSTAIIHEAAAASDTFRITGSNMFTSLTPGSNTFKMQYKSGSGAAIEFRRRAMFVIPL